MAAHPITAEIRGLDAATGFSPYIKQFSGTFLGLGPLGIGKSPEIGWRRDHADARTPFDHPRARGVEEDCRNVLPAALANRSHRVRHRLGALPDDRPRSGAGALALRPCRQCATRSDLADLRPAVGFRLP